MSMFNKKHECLHVLGMRFIWLSQFLNISLQSLLILVEDFVISFMYACLVYS